MLTVDGSSFTDNAGLCGIPGLPTCGTHFTVGAKIGIGLGACVFVLLIATCLTCWWKRRQNILRAQRIAGKILISNVCSYWIPDDQVLTVPKLLSILYPARDAPYAKSRTHSNRDIQLSRNFSHEHTRTANENGPPLLS